MFEQWQPRLKRIKDSFLMDHVPDEVGEKEAKQLNRCRMYLHALTVSNIATPDGKELDRGALRGINNISFKSAHKWSQQKQIYNQGWKEWKLFLVKNLCDAGTYNLEIPIGDWIKRNNHHKWKTFQHPVTKDLYRNTEIRGKDVWRKHRPMKNKEDIFNNSPGIKSNPPKYAYRISLRSHTKNTWIYYPSGGQPVSTDTRQIEQPEKGEDFFERYFEPNYESKILNIENTSKIAAAITCTTAVGGSDGSMKKNKRTAGWSIETNEGSRCRISGAGMVDGVQNTNDSNRAERGGRVGILAVVLKIAKMHNITKGHIKIVI